MIAEGSKTPFAWTYCEHLAWFQEETDRARDLYRRLLSKTQHVKVWLSYAQFEFQVEHEDNILQARHIFEQANKSLRQAPNSGEASGKESRLLLLEAWQEFEEEQGDDITQVSKISKQIIITCYNTAND